MKKTLIGLGVLGCATTAWAGEWSGEGELGFTLTTGNTETSNLNARLQLEQTRDAWVNTLGLEALQASENEDSTAERYLLTGKTAYDYDARHYAFGSLRYDVDRFSGYDYQASLVLGRGLHLIAEERVTLDLEAGLGVRASETESGESRTDAALQGGLSYANRFTDTATFSEDVILLAGGKNNFIESSTGLKVKINSSLALKLSYTIKHNSAVEPGLENTDTITAVNLLYAFE